MKNLLTILISLLAATIMTATTTPDAKLIANEDVELVAVDMEGHELFESAIYDTSEELIVLKTKSKVQVIQIFNAAGELEFQLPVMSNKVSISKAIFSRGESQLSFVMDSTADVYMTTITVR